MSQPYNPYIGQIPGQQSATPQTWLPGNQNVTLPYVTPAPKQTIFGKSGDAQKGEEIARNLCNTMGITPEEATKQAANFFNIPR